MTDSSRKVAVHDLALSLRSPQSRFRGSLTTTDSST
jgi:hypothetical protein